MKENEGRPIHVLVYSCDLECFHLLKAPTNGKQVIKARNSPLKQVLKYEVFWRIILVGDGVCSTY